MKQLKQTYKIKAPIGDVWQALTEPAIISKWGGGPAKMSPELGDFSLWGGDIYGVNTKVIINKLIEQDWYSGKKWSHPSRVAFKLIASGNSTNVQLVHKNIPDKDYKDIEAGWRDFYLGPIKLLLED